MVVPRRFNNIFDVMDHVQSRPRMWELQTVEKIEAFCGAYYTGLAVHRISECDVPKLSVFHFGAWLQRHFGWPYNCGWAHAIRSHCSSEEEAIGRFFELISRYRRLRPVLLGEADVSQERRAVEPIHTNHWPRKVQLFRYAPDRFYFLKAVDPDCDHDHFFGSRPKAISYSEEVYKVRLAEWRFIKPTATRRQSSATPKRVGRGRNR